MQTYKLIEYDIQSNEADILVTDGEFEILGYCLLLSDIKKIAIKKLFGFMCENIKISNCTIGLEKTENYYSYRIRAEVKSLHKNIVNVGDIEIELDKPIPKDINEGDIIEFDVSRIDIIV